MVFCSRSWAVTITSSTVLTGAASWAQAAVPPIMAPVRVAAASRRAFSVVLNIGFPRFG